MIAQFPDGNVFEVGGPYGGAKFGSSTDFFGDQFTKHFYLANMPQAPGRGVSGLGSGGGSGGSGGGSSSGGSGGSSGSGSFGGGGSSGGVGFDLKSLASGAFSDMGFGNVLGGKSPMDWGVAKMAEPFLSPFASALPGGGNLSMPGGGGFSLGSMSGMMPSIVKMVAQSSGMVPLAPSAVGTSLSPADARGGGGTVNHVDNSINIHGLQDPNQVQQAMMEERNRLNQRREVAMPNIKATGPGGG
jgi:hypothetical protein